MKIVMFSKAKFKLEGVITKEEKGYCRVSI
jgi:hypothetical protein